MPTTIPASLQSTTYTNIISSHQYIDERAQKIKKIVMYVLGILAIFSAVSLTILSAVSIIHFTGGLAAIPCIIAAIVLIYKAKTTWVPRQLPSELIKGPYKGIYEGNFFTALNTNQPTFLTSKQIVKRKDRLIWEQVEQNYNTFITCVKTETSENIPPKIPYKIHLIWLGAEPSEDVLKIQNSWEKFHPDWEVKLYRNEEALEIITQVGQEFPNIIETWDQAETFAEKADILRYCILYIHGGFYADTDLLCFGHLQELHHFSDFYSCIEQIDCPELTVCNAALGAKPGHPILKQILENICPKGKIKGRDSILDRTGPRLVSRIIRQALIKDHNDKTTHTLVLPSTYFFPLPYRRSRFDKGAVPHKRALEFVRPETKGLHLWNGSWK